MTVGKQYEPVTSYMKSRNLPAEYPKEYNAGYRAALRADNTDFPLCPYVWPDDALSVSAWMCGFSVGSLEVSERKKS
jgi:hypothetical protein